MKNFVYVVYTGETKDKLMYSRVYKAEKVFDGYFITIDNLHQYYVYASLCVLLDGNKVEELMKKFPVGCKVEHRDGMVFTVAWYNYSNTTFYLSPGNFAREGYYPEYCVRIDVEQPELVNNTYQYFFSAQELNGEKECLSNHNPFINIEGKMNEFKKAGYDLISYKLISKLDTPGILAFFKKG